MPFLQNEYVHYPPDHPFTSVKGELERDLVGGNREVLVVFGIGSIGTYL
jgi:hypothetical protein